RRHPFPGADEGARGQGPRHLAYARHARHTLRRRHDRRALRARQERRFLAQGRRMAPDVPDHRHDSLPADLPRLSPLPPERPRHTAPGPAKKRPASPPVTDLAGRLDTTLRAAQLAHRWMVEIVERNAPSADTVNEVMIGRSLVAKNAIAAVELAMELAGGASF